MNLDLVAKHPACARELDRDACLELIAQAAAVHAVLLLRFQETSVHGDEADAIGVQEAARLLGVSPKTMANGAGSRYKSFRLPTLARKLAFSRRAILTMQQDHRGLVLGTVGPHLLRAPGRKRPRRGGPAPSPFRHGEGGAV